MYKFWHERPKPGPDHEVYMAERRKVKDYFEPYCQGEIKSLQEAGSAYMLAVIESEEAGVAARVGSPTEGTARRRAIVHEIGHSGGNSGTQEEHPNEDGLLSGSLSQDDAGFTAPTLKRFHPRPAPLGGCRPG